MICILHVYLTGKKHLSGNMALLGSSRVAKSSLIKLYARRRAFEYKGNAYR
ncbi:hypothetical protein JY742_19605 [Clostridioides difficile]|nr:hypothetical protein [Clostridioides difficile]